MNRLDDFFFHLTLMLMGVGMFIFMLAISYRILTD
jgi:hypothetical protein